MSTHTIHLAKYCNDLEVLDILEEIGDYLDSLDPEKFKIPKSRQNKPECFNVICDQYLSEFRTTVRPGPPWHQNIHDLLLNLNTRHRNQKIAGLATTLGKRITGRKQALSAIYPPGGYLGWHTNADVPGRNLIFTWSKTGEGIFRYKNYTKGYFFDIPDHIGWNVKSFDWFSYGESEKEGYSWHCAGASCMRATLAFVIHNNPMSDAMLEEDFNLTPWSPGCFISEEDMHHKSEWWDINKDNIINSSLDSELIKEINNSPSGVKYGPR